MEELGSEYLKQYTMHDDATVYPDLSFLPTTTLVLSRKSTMGKF